MALDIALLQNMGMPEILLWLLTFAIVYGVISKLKMFNREVSAIIGIVAGFLVLLAAPANLITVLSSMSQGLILVILGVIILMVFLEVAGIRHKEAVLGKDPNTGKTVVVREEDVAFFSAHKYILVIVFVIIAVLLFVGAGGLQLLGWSINFTTQGMGTIIIFVIIILAVMWMITESGKGKQ